MIGAVPSGWRETTLGRVLQRSPSYGINAPALPRGVGRYPYLRITDIDEAGRVDFGALPSVRDSASDVFVLSDGDIVVARTGASVGKSHLFKDQGEPVVFAGFLIRLSADRDAIIPDYLAQFMQTAQYWDWIRENSARSGQPGVNGQQLQTIPFVLPPLHEQQAIAAALSDADGVVAGLERVIAKKRLIKQGAMQDLLTARRRLPGFSGDWEVKRLGDICRLDMGGTPSRRNSAFWGKGYPWLTIADMQSKVIYSSKEQLTDEGAALLTPVKAGTLIMSFKLSIGRLAFAGVDLFTNEAICSFNDLGEDPDFLFYALGRTDFALYGKQAVKGYTLNKQSLKEVEVFMPEKREQQAIAAVLADMDAEIQTLESRLTKARAVKEGMMQNLLTGRVRLV